MSIKLTVESYQEQRVKDLGGCWMPDANAWVIPDKVDNINPFMEWLPKVEGFIVQRPYFVARAKMPCYQCGKETPIITLGAKFAQELVYKTEKEPVWVKWDSPVFFTEIDYLDSEISAFLQKNYPFFKLTYSEALEQEIWGTTCIHCGALQEEEDEFRYEANPLSPVTLEDTLEIRVIYFTLKFDYYISSGYCMNELYGSIITK